MQSDIPEVIPWLALLADRITENDLGAEMRRYYHLNDGIIVVDASRRPRATGNISYMVYDRGSLKDVSFHEGHLKSRLLAYLTQRGKRDG